MSLKNCCTAELPQLSISKASQSEAVLLNIAPVGTVFIQQNITNWLKRVSTRHFPYRAGERPPEPHKDERSHPDGLCTCFAISQSTKATWQVASAHSPIREPSLREPQPDFSFNVWLASMVSLIPSYLWSYHPTHYPPSNELGLAHDKSCCWQHSMHVWL